VGREIPRQGTRKYAQEYLINPFSLSGSKLSLEWLHYWDENDRQEEDLIYYFGVDPAVSGKGDYMCICVLAKGKHTIYVEDFIREKAGIVRTIELLERTARIYPPATINIEAIAAQDFLVQEMRQQTSLPVRSYKPRMGKKDKIPLMAQVYFASKKVLLRGVKQEYSGHLVAETRMQAFVAEWIAFDRGKHDDTLDATEAAVECATSSGIAAIVAGEETEQWEAEGLRNARQRRWGM
jgi:predicted phage terminase large subunit-like protein